jgi:hypothetical protein
MVARRDDVIGRVRRSLQEWHGFYSRIPGEQSAWHVRQRLGQWGACVLWIQRDGNLWTCWVADHRLCSELGSAVNEAKGFLGASPGGSFHVNEFRQILVPARDSDGRIAVAGVLEGDVEFISPDGDRVNFTGAGAKCGDVWQAPYVGMKFRLSRMPNNRVSRSRVGRDGEFQEWPPTQDGELIRRLRSLRGASGGRFVVTHEGTVITKCETINGWSPTFVGRIDPSRWFAPVGLAGLVVAEAPPRVETLSGGLLTRSISAKVLQSSVASKPGPRTPPRAATTSRSVGVSTSAESFSDAAKVSAPTERPMTTCPRCGVKVGTARLQRHLSRSHAP